MKNLNFYLKFIDIFSYPKKEKKKDYDFLTIIIFHESTGVRQLAAALATKRRPIEPIPAPPPPPPLRNPFKRRTTKVIKSSHYGAWIGINGRADVYPLSCTNFPTPRRVPSNFDFNSYTRISLYARPNVTN